MNKVLLLWAAAALITSMFAVSSCRGGGGAGEAGSVYVMTNSTAANTVLVFERSDNGGLEPQGSFDTQGKGAGSTANPLSSQGALALSRDGRWLLAVNAGSNEITVFKVTSEGLEFASKTSSLGQFPASVSSYGSMVVVLNKRSVPPNITAFSMDKNGVLTANSGTTRQLPPGNYSQVGFSPNGRWLVASGESINLLLAYQVNGSNLAADPIIAESSGRGPAGFTFDESGNLLVAEASSNSVSSYSVSSDGLKPITASLSTGQTGPRWLAVAGEFVYVMNSSSGSIGSFAISNTVSGQLSLTGAAFAGAGFTELTVSSDGRYLYAIDTSNRAVISFAIGSDGKLTSSGSVGALFGLSVQGIAAG